MNIKEWWSRRFAFLKKDPDTEEIIDNDGHLLKTPLDDDSQVDILIPAGKPKLSIKEKIKTRFHYYIPVFSWLPKYNFKQQIVGDVVAGLGVGAMLVPQSLAYAALAKLNPIHGLYTAWVCYKAILT